MSQNGFENIRLEEKKTVRSYILWHGIVGVVHEAMVKDVASGEFFVTKRVMNSTDMTKAALIADMEKERDLFYARNQEEIDKVNAL